MDKRITNKEFIDKFSSSVIERDTIREVWGNFSKDEKEQFRDLLDKLQRWCWIDGYFYIQKEVNRFALRNCITLAEATDVIDDVLQKQKFIKCLQNTMQDVSNQLYFYEDTKKFAEWLGISLPPRKSLEKYQ